MKRTFDMLSENEASASIKERALDLLSKCGPKPVIVLDLDFTVNFLFQEVESMSTNSSLHL